MGGIRIGSLLKMHPNNHSAYQPLSVFLAEDNNALRRENDQLRLQLQHQREDREILVQQLSFISEGNQVLVQENAQMLNDYLSCRQKVNRLINLLNNCISSIDVRDQRHRSLKNRFQQMLRENPTIRQPSNSVWIQRVLPSTFFRQQLVTIAQEDSEETETDSE